MSEVEHTRLVRLIRQVAKEVAFEVLDEHLGKFRHEQKRVADTGETGHG